MRMLCKTKRILSFFSKRIIGDSGEGVILRKPESVYERGRSESLLKIKTARADAEALVTNVGTDLLTLKLVNGTTFALESASYVGMRLKRGDIVTFDYANVTKAGKPVNPVISRVRNDTNWKDVIHDFLRERQGDNTPYNPRKYWTPSQKAHAKFVLENFVKRKNLDPSNPCTWYNEASTFEHKKNELPDILFEGNLAKNLQRLFPELNLDERKFGQRYKGFWNDVNNRKAFFDAFAASAGFDPLLPNNWYKVTRLQIEGFKGLGSILHYYQQSFPAAIFHVYPDIGVKKEKFILYQVGHWDEHTNRRMFFDNFAKECGFDPLVPDNWYKVSAKQINSLKDSRLLLRRFHNFTDAIADAYPDIGFERNQCDDIPRNHWFSKSNRKAFFDAFAKSKSFDPLDPSEWYKVAPADLRAAKGGMAVLDHYDRSLENALCHVYPTLRFDGYRFALPHGHWAEAKHRREFFEKFAKKFNFDPLDSWNWHNVSLEMLRAEEGFKSVVRHHGNNHKKALQQLFPDIGIDKHKFVRIE